MDGGFENCVIALGKEMGVIDTADLVILDPPPGFDQRIAVPADAFDCLIVIDVIGDIEQVIALVRRPLEALRRQKTGDSDGQIGHLGAEKAFEFERWFGPGLLDQIHAFFDPFAAFLHLDPEGIELIADEPTPDAEIETPP